LYIVVILYTKVGGTKLRPSPYPEKWGGHVPPVPPGICAHASESKQP